MKRTHWTSLVTLLSIAAIGACTDKSGEAAEAAAAAAASGTRAAPVAATRTLDAGRQFTVVTSETISSSSAKVGDSFGAAVLDDVQDARGRVAIPAGSMVYGTVRDVKAGTSPKSLGTLTLAVSSVTVRGENYPLDARIESLATEREGRGLTGEDAVKVGVGAAAGAVVGQIIGKNPRGTIIGAATGAAAGAGYAAATKDSDIRLPAGTHITITLGNRLTVSGS